MKPRILIYSTAYYPLVGGAEVAIKEITDRLADQYDFDLITARINRHFPQTEKIGAVNIYRMGWGSFLDKWWLILRGGSFGLKLHQEKSYHMVWAMMASYGGLAASSFKSMRQEIPYLLTLQEGDDLAEVERRVSFFRKKWQKIFTQADYVQCISNYLSEWAKKNGANCPIELIPNGVDLEKIKNQRSEERSLKQQGERAIITTSRLVKKNGIDDLIKSLQYLPETVKLWILGVGPEEINLKKLAIKLEVSHKIQWFGFIDNQQLFPYLKDADVFVRPSLTEGLGNSFLEAMAVGLPTVGTPVGGIVDFLKERETGWLAEVRNPESIAKAVNFILDPANKNEVEKIASQGKDLVYARYDWNMVAGEMGEIFEKLVNSPTQ